MATIKIDNLPNLTDWSIVREKVLPAFAPIEDGSTDDSYLDGKPHTLIKGTDFIVVYYVPLGEVEGGIARNPITDKQFKAFGISLDELHDTAIKNLENSEVYLKSLMETIMEMQGITENVYGLDDNLYVLSNKGKLHGAVEILNRKAMQKAAEKLGVSFYILPSSLHEVLLVKADEADEEALRKMVGEVNDTCVQKSEILSYNLYKYDVNTYKISMVV